MNKKVKKIVSAVLLTLALAGTATTASAATGHFDFNLKVGSKNSSSLVNKADNEQTAYITTTSGNIISSDEIWMRVRDSSSRFATNAVRIKSNSGRYTTPYAVRRGVKGANYRLFAESDKMTTHTVGRWTA